MNRWQDITGKLNYGLYLVLAALLPFPQTFLRYACVVWFVCWLLEGRWLKRPLPLHENRAAVPFLLFGLWYAWKAMSFFWSPDAGAWSSQMERYLTFGLMVLPGLWGVNGYYDWRQAGRVLAVSCFIAMPVYMLWMAILFRHPEIVPHLHLHEEWIQHNQWWTFFAENISHFKHRLFLCSVELLGVVAALQVWRDKKWLLALTLPVMLASIPMTGSRQALLTALVMGVAALLMRIPRQYRWRYGTGVVMLGGILCYGVFALHPRMKQIDISTFSEFRNLSYNHDVRLNIWGAALQHPGDYAAYGLGAGQSPDYIAGRFKEAHFDYFVQVKHHAHNQYLEELMEIGIPGLLLFIAAWLSVLLCARGEGKFSALMFTLLYMTNMLTDCMFAKFCGVALWAVGMMFICLQYDPSPSPPTPSAANLAGCRG